MRHLSIKYSRKTKQYQVINGQVISEHPTKLDARIAAIGILSMDLHKQLLERIEAAEQASYYEMQDSESVIKRLVSGAELALLGRIRLHDESKFDGRLRLVATIDSKGDGELIRHLHFAVSEQSLMCDCEDFTYDHAAKCKHIYGYEFLTGEFVGQSDEIELLF